MSGETDGIVWLQTLLAGLAELRDSRHGAVGVVRLESVPEGVTIEVLYRQGTRAVLSVDYRMTPAADVVAALRALS